MRDVIEAMSAAMPSATPTEEEIQAWEALPREEQLRRLRAALTHPDCGIATTDTMAEIRVEAVTRADLRRD
jgi:hypothetical protein